VRNLTRGSPLGRIADLCLQSTCLLRSTESSEGSRASVLPTVEEVYRLHAADVARWAARLGGPRLELEDVVQEVFAQVHRHLEGYRGEAQLTTWLFRITENAVRQHRRRNRWRRFLHKSSDDVAQELPSSDPSAADSVERRQSRELIHRALDRLGERYRIAIVLFELEDLSGEEVADRMGIKLSNLWVLLHRARAELVRQVSKLREEEP
jgi:RNA polymerase sigma-70 factor (ECF subfamily)